MKKGILLAAIVLFCFVGGCSLLVGVNGSNSRGKVRAETGILSNRNQFTPRSLVRLDADTFIGTFYNWIDSDSAMVIRLTLPEDHFAAGDSTFTAQIYSVDSWGDRWPTVDVEFYRNGETDDDDFYYYTSRTAGWGVYDSGKVIFFIDDSLDVFDENTGSDEFYRIPLADTRKYVMCYPADALTDTCIVGY